MFFQNLGSFGNQVAAVCADGRTLTYRDLNSESNRAAALFSERKKLVFLLAQNDLKTLITYIALLKAGHTCALINPRIHSDLLQNLIAVYQPDFVCDSNREMVQRNCPSKEIYPNLALLLSTSGSTGSPRFVRLTAKNLDSNASAIAEYLRLTSSDRPITTLPFSYSYGLSVINSHLAVGATLILTDDSLVSKNFWNMLRQHQPTSMAGVPYTYEMLKRLNFVQNAPASLHTLTQAGGKLDPQLALEIAEAANARGIRFFIMYGQTEAAARIAFLDPAKVAKKPNSIGQPIPRGHLEVLDQNKPNREGELVYRGPNVMMGYAESHLELAKGDELHGILHTGDIGYFDEDRDFYITGRRNRFLKIFGNRVNLDEAEQMLKRQGIECAAGGSDDRICIAVLNKDRVFEVRKTLSSFLGIHHSAIEISVVPEIPKNDAGKVLYGKVFPSVK